MNLAKKAIADYLEERSLAEIFEDAEGILYPEYIHKIDVERIIAHAFKLVDDEWFQKHCSIINEDENGE